MSTQGTRGKILCMGLNSIRDGTYKARRRSDVIATGLCCGITEPAAQPHLPGRFWIKKSSALKNSIVYDRFTVLEGIPKE
jgi:hypothetical protein